MNPHDKIIFYFIFIWSACVLAYSPAGLLVEFESEPVFPDERAWFWKWLVLAIGCVLLLLLASTIVLWPRPGRKIYRISN